MLQVVASRDVYEGYSGPLTPSDVRHVLDFGDDFFPNARVVVPESSEAPSGPSLLAEAADDLTMHQRALSLVKDQPWCAVTAGADPRFAAEPRGPVAPGSSLVFGVSQVLGERRKEWDGISGGTEIAVTLGLARDGAFSVWVVCAFSGRDDVVRINVRVAGRWRLRDGGGGGVDLEVEPASLTLSFRRSFRGDDECDPEADRRIEIAGNVARFFRE